MGDRGNVIIKDTDDSQVVLYTHWEASTLPATVKRAIARRQRWQDAAYLARIVFSEMIRNDINSETGYGISAHLLDGHDKVIEIDTKAQTIKVFGKSLVSFEKFVA